MRINWSLSSGMLVSKSNKADSIVLIRRSICRILTRVSLATTRPIAPSFWAAKWRLRSRVNTLLSCTIRRLICCISKILSDGGCQSLNGIRSTYSNITSASMASVLPRCNEAVAKFFITLGLATMTSMLCA